MLFYCKINKSGEIHEKVSLIFAYIKKKLYLCVTKRKKVKIMARPIRETPVLTGEDAVRFEEDMKRVEQMPASERRQNRVHLEDACRSFMSNVRILL